ncbi:hypothetical protein GA707_14940 [Nostocoides sp. F2B08]|uniref:exonuclease domain-containing protein n=1 Tax=Nostocoides sp. F2B08 TaxID=2653936 RepID=UPI001263D02B|nr:exonuclease domain-containing protein [Tetrasphaera sp. F2B08]KAB7742949.1 hypothetical protein GA707_14940 [Tetrasphaera sp. F2B08]
MLDFTAIDFETANSYRGSPCAVGLIRYRNGQPVDERRWLIRPPEQVDYFAPFNVALHGIDADTVRGAPRWQTVLPAIVDYIGDDVVVAHNAGFDIGVIRYACAVDNIEWPEMRFLCTLVMSRRAIRLPSYRLPFVCEAVGFEMGDHHDPLADARAAGRIILALAELAGTDQLAEVAAAHHMSIGRMSSGIYIGSVATSGGGTGLTFPGVNPEADPDGYLFGRVVVFTGTLMSMTRQIAWEECARVGARADKTPTKRTNVLVVGDINPAVLRPGANITGKARKAFELQDEGQHIEVMTEDDFLRCLDGGAFDKFVLPDGGVKELTIQPRERKVPLDARQPPAEPKPHKPPRPLRREWVPTDQTCSVEGCSDTAMFRTRTKPAFCNVHIGAILWQGGLIALESFTHPQDYLLTRCVQCENVAHYRFEYVQQKIGEGERTCRACYWRKWSQESMRLEGRFANLTPVTYADAQAIAEAHGFRYLGPLTNPSLPSDPHRTECVRCGKITAERLADIAFGCTCTPRE